MFSRLLNSKESVCDGSGSVSGKSNGDLKIPDVNEVIIVKRNEYDSEYFYDST